VDDEVDAVDGDVVAEAVAQSPSEDRRDLGARLDI
jgi:hypothetical protein